MKVNRKILASLPKIELHLHLDCSLSYNVVELLQPGIAEAEYKTKFNAPKNSSNLSEVLQCASSGILLMQTGDQLQAVVEDLFQQLKADNIIYVEIRFAPLLHLGKGLRAEEVVEIVAESVDECIDSTGIKAGIILCTLRHFNEEQSLQTIELIEKYIGNTPVAGLDIASDEAGFPVDAHVEAFSRAIRNGIPRTAHAGEAAGAESVWETLKYFQPNRIGHGVRSVEDKLLIEHLATNKIHLEISPSSNILARIYEKYEDHPINLLYESGVSVGVNSDGKSLINVSLTDEYVKLAYIFGWDIKHFYQCNLNALEHAFISNAERNELRKILVIGYEEILEY